MGFGVEGSREVWGKLSPYPAAQPSATTWGTAGCLYGRGKLNQNPRMGAKQAAAPEPGGQSVAVCSHCVKVRGQLKSGVSLGQPGSTSPAAQLQKEAVPQDGAPGVHEQGPNAAYWGHIRAAGALTRGAVACSESLFQFVLVGCSPDLCKTL